MSRLRRNWGSLQGHKDVLLIDAMNLAYRMAFTMGKLRHGDVGTGVIYGFVKNLKDLLERFQPKQVIIVWEGKQSRLRRKALYPGYKAKRKSNLPIEKEDFYQQIYNLREVLYYLGIDSVEVDKLEADDTIAVLSRHFAMQKKKVVIVSTDTDLLQLISMWVEVYSPTKEVVVHEANFHEVVGIALSDFVDYKCLVGDTSDNIPGVMGIGEVRAKSITDFMGLRMFLEQDVTTIKDKKLQHLFTPEGRAELLLAQQLIDLSIVPESAEEVLDKVVSGRYDSDEARDLLIDYNMWSILDTWEDFTTVFGKDK